MTAKDKAKGEPAGSFLDRLQSSGRTVEKLALGEMIDYSNIAPCVVRYLRSDRMPAGSNGRPWLKHVFTIPSGDVFALGGCMDLDTRLRSVKKGDTLGLAYLGSRQLDDTRTQHDWSVTLLTVTGDSLKALIAECAAVYPAIRDAVEHTKAKRIAERDAGRGGDEAPPHTDDDYAAWG